MMIMKNEKVKMRRKYKKKRKMREKRNTHIGIESRGEQVTQLMKQMEVIGA